MISLICVLLLPFSVALDPLYHINHVNSGSPMILSDSIDTDVYISVNEAGVVCNGQQLLQSGMIGYFFTDKLSAWYSSDGGSVNATWMWLTDVNNHYIEIFNCFNLNIHISNLNIEIEQINSEGQLYTYIVDYVWVAYCSKIGNYVSNFLSSPDDTYQFFLNSPSQLYTSGPTNDKKIYSIVGDHLIIDNTVQELSISFTKVNELNLVKTNLVRDEGVSYCSNGASITVYPYIYLVPAEVQSIHKYDYNIIVQIMYFCIIFCAIMVFLNRNKNINFYKYCKNGS